MNHQEDARLPPAAEALLDSWPSPARDDAAWEALAARIDARIEAGDAGPTDDALLLPPLLDAGAGEPDGSELSGDESAATPTRPALSPEPARPRRDAPPGDGPSLAEIARAAVVRSSARDIQVARETLSHAARARATGEVATSVARAAETAAVELARVRAERAGRESQPDVTRRSAPPVATRSGVRGALVGAGVTLLATAAAFVLIARQTGTRAPQVTEVIVGSQGRASAPPATPELPTAPAREDVGTARVSRVDDLPPAPAAPAPAGTVIPRARVPAGKSNPIESPREKSEWDEPAGTPAEGQRGADVPLQPPIGELTAALGRGLSAARPCLAGQTQPSWATIVFGSNGRVQSVVLTGPVAGAPEETCVRNALMSITVRPFAKPTFEARSVRLSP